MARTKKKGKQNAYTTVSLPKPLLDKIQKLIDKSSFTSMSSFVAFVLRELIAEQGNNSIIASEERVKERLRALGYL